MKIRTAKGTIRTTATALAIATALMLSPAIASLVVASAAARTQVAFSGSVSQSGPRWVTYPFTVAATGTITAQLNWTSSSADLNLFLQSPSGSNVACDCSTDRPASVTYNASSTGTWLIAVRAKTGASSFTATVTVPGPTGSPSPSPSQPASGQRAPASTLNHIGLFAQDWNSAASNRASSAWTTIAQNHDVLVGVPGTYCNHIAQLHAANPNLLVLVYDLGPYTVRGTSLYASLLSQHPNYFAHDASGRLLTVKAASGSGAFPNNTLMEPSQAGWRSQHAQRIASLIAQCGFDGVYVDSMGNGPMTGTTTGVPINPSTGRQYTDTQWLSALAQEMTAVKAAIGNKFIFTSGLGNGISYTQSTHLLAQSPIDGIMTDSWIRLASSSPSTYPSASLFKADLDMVQSIQSMGKSFFGWTKVWNSQASQTDFTNWDRFALASYLLVRGAHAYYSFSQGGESADRTTIYHSFEQSALGTALGAYTVANGVYTRQFQHGTVTVNPTSHSSSIVVH